VRHAAIFADRLFARTAPGVAKRIGALKVSHLTLARARHQTKADQQP